MRRASLASLLLLVGCTREARDCERIEVASCECPEPAATTTARLPSSAAAQSTNAAFPPVEPSPTAADVTLFFSVDVTKTGDLFVAGNKLSSFDDLLPLAKAAIARNPEIRATIRADQAVSHGHVIKVIDVLKQAGINKVAFGVAPASSAP